MKTEEIEMIRSAVDLLVLKALIATHPNPDQLRMVFDQLLGQLQANPVVLQDPEYSALIRRKAVELFSPPAPPDTGPPGAAQ